MEQKHDSYDVVVLGAGIGGLCSAALLANKGYKVFVAEKLGVIGGRCSTLNYKGYKLPTGVVGIPASGLLKSIFDEVGAEFEVAQITSEAKISLEDKIIDPPPGGDFGLLKLLGAEESEIAALKQGFKKTYKWGPPSNETSLLEFLQQYTNNKHIISNFSNKADKFVSVGAAEVSAREFFLSQQGYIKEFAGGHGIAPKGSIALMKALRQSIERNGGEVVTQCRAKKIHVRNGAVEGVTLQGKRGEMTLSTQVVISNTGPKHTIELVGREYFDDGYLREVGNMVPSLQMWVTSVSDRPLFDTPLLTTLGTRRMLSFMSVSLLSPHLAPKGKYVHYSISGPTSQVKPWNLREEVDLHILDLKERIPDFNQHGEVLHVGSYWGAWPTLRNAPLAGYHEIPQKTAVENLYNVGDGVAKSGGWPGGSPSVALTARLVVDEIESRSPPGASS